MTFAFCTSTSHDASVRRARIATLPVGSFEQHGDHLPLATDTLIACEIARRVAATYELFLLPPVAVTCSQEHAKFPGTVSIRAVTLVAVVDDIAQSLNRSGIPSLILVNGHGGNHVLANVVCEHNAAGRPMMLFPTMEDWCTARIHAEIETTDHDDMHGGELETSILLHAYPELVSDSYKEADHEARDRPHLLMTGMAGYTTSGIIGRPSLATAAKGQAALDSLNASFAYHLKQLTGKSL